MTYQVLTCPNCGGSGRLADGRPCPTCNGTGKVRVSTEQLQKIKMLSQQLGQTGPSSLPASAPPQAMQADWTANLSGIIAWSILAIIAGAGAASWYFLKSLRPFLFGLGSLLTLVGTRFAWKQPFFQPQEPDDFLKAVKNH